MSIYGNFEQAITTSLYKLLSLGVEVKPKNWQSMDVSKLPEATMKELLFHSLQVPVPPELYLLQDQIKPNLPWADNHFRQERVSGCPINPGETWKDWPWANSANTFLKHGVFDHSYAERYWPKWAGPLGYEYTIKNPEDTVNRGIRGEVGDLIDVVDRLEKDPGTRQAVLSVWHPEDQLDRGQRVPCSLSYQFITRGSYLHIIYNIRSCDAYRHFRDDIYLTCRLLLWVLTELRKRDPIWDNVLPGFFVMNIGSFHCFINDIHHIKGWL